MSERQARMVRKVRDHEMVQDLLKEAARELGAVQYYIPPADETVEMTPAITADVGACQKLAERIDTYLAALHESAMEVVDQLDHLINDNQGIRADFDHNKASALIESHGRRVQELEEWQARALPWLRGYKKFVSGERIEVLSALIAEAKPEEVGNAEH